MTDDEVRGYLHRRSVICLATADELRPPPWTPQNEQLVYVADENRLYVWRDGWQPIWPTEEAL